MYALLTSPMRATYPAHLILLALITPTILGEERVRKAYKILIGKPEGSRPLTRPRHRLEGRSIIKTGLQETECKEVE
jgi:hypothetical protein